MEEILEFTKSQLIEAFEKWNIDYAVYAADTERFHEAIELYAQSQANALIEYLNKKD